MIHVVWVRPVIHVMWVRPVIYRHGAMVNRSVMNSRTMMANVGSRTSVTATMVA
jgi:hypothetical protein